MNNQKFKVIKAKEERKMNEEGKRTSRVLLTIEYNGEKYRMVFSDRDLNNTNLRRWMVFLDVLKLVEDEMCDNENIFYFNSTDKEETFFEVEDGFEDICREIFSREELKEFFPNEELNSLIDIINENKID